MHENLGVIIAKMFVPPKQVDLPKHDIENIQKR